MCWPGLKGGGCGAEPPLTALGLLKEPSALTRYIREGEAGPER